jgi:hypothetical protein
VVESWDGDASEFEPHIEIVRNEHEIAERLFASKREAFDVGG